MSYDDEEVESGFKIGADDDELLDMPEGEMPELPDEEDDDPENRFH